MKLTSSCTNWELVLDMIEIIYFFFHVADFVQGSFFVFRSRFSEIFREIRYFVVDLNRILFNVKIESSIDYDIL